MRSGEYQPENYNTLRTMATDCGMDFSLEIPEPDDELIALFPKEVACRYHAIPVARTPFGISIHVSDPLDFEAIDAIRHILKEDLSPIVTPQEIIAKAIEEIYG